MQYRQGDIFLEKADDDLPELEDCKQSIEGNEVDKFIVLALGEATGHAHKLSSQGAILKKAVNSNQFFLVVKEPSDLIHEEHSKISLPPGKYRVRRQRIYTPEKPIFVAD